MKPPASAQFYRTRKPSSLFDCLVEVIIRYFDTYKELQSLTTSFREHSIELTRGFFGPCLLSIKKNKYNDKSYLRKVMELYQQISEVFAEKLVENLYELDHLTKDDEKTLLKLVDLIFENITISLHFLSDLFSCGIPTFNSKISRKNPIRIYETLLKLSNFVHYGCCGFPLNIISYKSNENLRKVIIHTECPVCKTTREIELKLPEYRRLQFNSKTSYIDENEDETQQEDNQQEDH